jgi:hypothetical protein
MKTKKLAYFHDELLKGKEIREIMDRMSKAEWKAIRHESGQGEPPSPITIY